MPTPLMQSTQTIGMELPLKALIRQDPSGKTLLSYIDVRWLSKRHGLATDVEAAIAAMSAGLEAVVKTATTSP